MNKSIIYLLFLFTIVSYSQSSKLYQKTYTEQDGLEIDNIFTLCYDNDGFLWLGGNNLDDRTIILSDKKLALQRFNGHTFHNIPLPVYKNPIESIEQLYKRKDGKLYVVSKLSDGYALFLFDPLTTIYEEVNFNGFDFSLDGLSSIFSYREQDYLLIQKGRTVSLLKLELDLYASKIFSFTSTENKYTIEGSSKIIPFKNFVIISDDNFPVKVFDWNGNLLKIIDTVSMNNATAPKRVVVDEVFFKDSTHYLFLYNNPNLYKIDVASKTIILDKKNNLPNTHLNTYSDSNNQTVIFASKNEKVGFNTYDGTKIKQEFSIDFNRIDGIKIVSNNLKKEFWLATNGELHYFKLPNKTVINYLPDYEFRAIKALDSSNYLVATEFNGWFKINPITNTINPYKIKLNNNAFHSPSRNFILEDTIIWSNGNAGIIKTNTETKSVESYRHHPITCLEKPNDSIIVYGTNRYHLMQFNTLTKVHTSLLKSDSLNISDITILKNSSLVIAATDKGLISYDLVSKKNEYYTSKDGFEDVFLLMADYHEDYGYLLGSRSGHIYAFNPENKTVSIIYKDALKAGIATIIFDDNLWWINTFNGIVAFNPKNKTSTRFSEKDGFSHHETNRYSALKTKHRFLVGTIKGLNYFNPNELKAQNDSASLVLLKVKQFDKKSKTLKEDYNRINLETNNTITIPSENRILEIGFGLKNTNAIDNGYSYRYRLDENDWIDIKQQNRVQFPNLAAGNYILEIEAKDFSGSKIGKSLILHISSKEFFYKTWWFFALVSVAIISFLLWLLQQATNRKLLQEQFSQGLIQSQEDERKRIARELHDSISQQLTLIKKKAQNTNQEEITALTHNTLEEVRAISRGLYPPLLKQLGLTESIEQLILDVDEQTELFVSGDIEKIDAFFNEDQTLNCYRFIQECVNNCLKHADAKALSVSVLKFHNNIEICIRDNGKGFNAPNAKKQNSLGLKTIYERIRILKGELTLDSKPNQGTLIIAKIPLNNG